MVVTDTKTYRMRLSTLRKLKREIPPRKNESFSDYMDRIPEKIRALKWKLTQDSEYR